MNGPDPTARPRDCGNYSAPYVLGALEPTEARAFADHMQSCAVCRDEVAALAPALDVLPACAPRCDVSPALRRRVMRAVRSEPKAAGVPRRRLRLPRWTPWRPAVATALALAGALGVVITLGVLIAARPSGSPARVIQASVGEAQVRIAGGHGELIVKHLPPAPPERVYELWLQRDGHAPAPSTLFAVTSRGTAVLAVPGEITGIARVLVTVEPSGGSRVPTTRAVIVART
jgi:anti-sigma-K factor RskA